MIHFVGFCELDGLFVSWVDREKKVMKLLMLDFLQFNKEYNVAYLHKW